MRRMLITVAPALLLAAIAGSSVFAQANTATAQRPSANQKVTLVGCVERADQVLAREDLGTTVDSLSFVLIKADEAGKAKPSAQAEGKTYRLNAATDTLNPHVGHKVEIAGVMTPVGTAGSNGGVSGVGVPPMVRVESVKMIAPTCAR